MSLRQKAGRKRKKRKKRKIKQRAEEAEHRLGRERGPRLLPSLRVSREVMTWNLLAVLTESGFLQHGSCTA